MRFPPTLCLPYEPLHALHRAAELRVRTVDVTFQIIEQPDLNKFRQLLASTGQFTYSLCSTTSRPIRPACSAIVVSVPEIVVSVLSCSCMIIYTQCST